MYDSQEISKVSQNLSLRLSPERKYRPSYSSYVSCLCSPPRCCNICHFVYAVIYAIIIPADAMFIALQ